MATPYYHHAMTTLGLQLLAKQQLGVTPVITRAAAGRGYVDPAGLEAQTEVSEPVGEMDFGPRTLVDSRVVRLMGDLLEENEQIRQVGVYARDPDEGEILYQLLQYEEPQSLPCKEANYGVAEAFDAQIDLVFGNGEAAEIPTSPGWYLSRADLDAHNTDPGAHSGMLAALSQRLVALAEEFAASQAAQDTRIKLLEDTLITDIQDNKKIITFANPDAVEIIQGVYNAAASRLEC